MCLGCYLLAIKVIKSLALDTQKQQKRGDTEVFITSHTQKHKEQAKRKLRITERSTYKTILKTNKTN